MMKLTAELDIKEIDGKDPAEGVTLLLVAEDGEDEISLVIDNDKDKITIVLDKSDLLDAVARLAGVAFAEAVPKQEVI